MVTGQGMKFPAPVICPYPMKSTGSYRPSYYPHRRRDREGDLPLSRRPAPVRIVAPGGYFLHSDAFVVQPDPLIPAHNPPPAIPLPVLQFPPTV